MRAAAGWTCKRAGTRKRAKEEGLADAGLLNNDVVVVGVVLVVGRLAASRRAGGQAGRRQVARSMVSLVSLAWPRSSPEVSLRARCLDAVACCRKRANTL